MTNREIQRLIDKAVNETVQRLKAEGIIRSERRSPEEKVEELLTNYPAFKRVSASGGTVAAVVEKIEAALKEISHDPYYDVIERYYFEGQTRDMIAIGKECRPETVSRNKSRLLHQLARSLMAEDVLREIMDG